VKRRRPENDTSRRASIALRVTPRRPTSSPSSSTGRRLWSDRPSEIASTSLIMRSTGSSSRPAMSHAVRIAINTTTGPKRNASPVMFAAASSIRAAETAATTRRTPGVTRGSSSRAATMTSDRKLSSEIKRNGSVGARRSASSLMRSRSATLRRATAGDPYTIRAESATMMYSGTASRRRRILGLSSRPTNESVITVSWLSTPPCSNMRAPSSALAMARALSSRVTSTRRSAMRTAVKAAIVPRSARV
jgi:hypothetical protein